MHTVICWDVKGLMLQFPTTSDSLHPLEVLSGGQRGLHCTLDAPLVLTLSTALQGDSRKI